MHAAFDSHPGRLKVIVADALDIGEAGTPEWLAMGYIEEALYGDDRLDLARPSHLRAWRKCYDSALEAFWRGAAIAVRRVAGEKVAGGVRNAGDAVYATTFATATFAEDAVIVASVAAELRDLGVTMCEAPSIWAPLLRRARRAQAGLPRENERRCAA